MSAAYQQQLDAKQQRIAAQFAEFQPPSLEVFASEQQHYRMRAEFRIWHSEDELFYAMFETAADGSKKVLRIDDFVIADRAIHQLMPRLRLAIMANPLLSQRLFEIDFLATLSGEVLVSLIYHRKLDQAWQEAAQQLQQQLQIKIIGRSRGQKIVLSDDFVIEKLQVNQQQFIYKQIENGFSQPNARICEKMLGWACDVAQNSTGDLLELYCGNGNFSLPLSQHFERVLATELAKSSVQAAEWNIAANHINNIQIARLSAEEFSQAYRGERQFRRLQQQHIDLTDYQFSSVFVDPPRAGIDDATLALLSQFERIIYISCNPDTLYHNLKWLSKSHHIRRFALFDQFPYTHHLECGLLLERKTA
jgi:tRNA (uracil-5-)-methyltransferase